MKTYNKLIRDKVPDHIASKGEPYEIHTADAQEYWTKLKQKLLEESKEFDKSETIDELADLLEVIYAICAAKKWTKADLEVARKRKLKKKGGYKKKIILERS